MPLLVYLAIGMLAGVLAGIFGVGGGIIVVPALVFFAGQSLRTAIGTSLGALLLPVGALGFWTYWKSGNVDVRGALLIAVGIFVGTLGGSLFALTLPEATLRKAFAVLLAAVAVRLWVVA